MTSARNFKNSFDEGTLNYKRNLTQPENNKWNQRNEDDDNLDQTQQKIGKTENDSLESLKRTICILNETHEIGINTAQVKFFKFAQIKVIMQFKIIVIILKKRNWWAKVKNSIK